MPNLLSHPFLLPVSPSRKASFTDQFSLFTPFVLPIIRRKSVVLFVAVCVFVLDQNVSNHKSIHHPASMRCERIVGSRAHSISLSSALVSMIHSYCASY